MTAYFYKSEVVKELNKEYCNYEGMMKYFDKTISNAIKLDNGGFILIEKPRIQTRFCFGYSDSPNCSEMYEAGDMAQHARTDVDYFVRKNLAPLYESLEDLKQGDICITKRYDNANIYSWHVSTPNNRYYQPQLEEERCSDNELLHLIKAYEEEITKFKKRLNTYLKRFGLSKVHTWTYWRDE